MIGSLLAGSLLEDRDVTHIYPLVFLPWAVGHPRRGRRTQPLGCRRARWCVAGFGNGLTFPITVLIIQRYTTDRLRGRAFTVIISAHNALLGIAMVAAGALDGSVGARWTYARRVGAPRLRRDHGSACSRAGSGTQGVVVRQQAA